MPSIERSSAPLSIDAPLSGVSARQLRNLLLRELPADEWDRLAPHLERVELPQRLVLYDPEQPIEHVWFPEDGIISLVSIMRDGSGIETATLGYDSMIGIAIFHGMNVTTEQALVQVAGHGHRMSSATLRALFPHLPTLTSRLHRLSHAMFSLASQNSGCNRKHAVEQRCARWLLMVHDRMVHPSFRLTHDFMSQMLGVRRASVTEALGALEQAGLIAATRGQIVIVDRRGLAARACECHAIISATFDRALLDVPLATPLIDIPVSVDGISTVRDGTPMPGADTDLR